MPPPRAKPEWSLRAFRAAAGFLTVLPVLPKSYQADLLPRSAALFPLVGALIGTFGAVVLLVTTQFLPPQFAAAAALLTTIFLTGALHEDGLADTADGLFGGFTPERRLEIMRDSRIGTFGAIALIFSLLIRWSAISFLTTANPHLAALALIFANAYGRLASITLAAILPHPPNSPAHKSGRFIGEFSLAAAIPFGLPLLVSTFFAFDWTPALVAIPATLTITILLIPFFKNRLGGINGDCLGAASQLAEIAFYLALTSTLWSAAA